MIRFTASCDSSQAKHLLCSSSVLFGRAASVPGVLPQAQDAGGSVEPHGRKGAGLRKNITCLDAGARAPREMRASK